MIIRITDNHHRIAKEDFVAEYPKLSQALLDRTLDNLSKEDSIFIFPNDLHFKVALTGCANDCQKVRMHDFGIIGMAKPELDESRCVSCGMCERKCKKFCYFKK